jgi:hypothetical protein
MIADLIRDPQFFMLNRIDAVQECDATGDAMNY